jgi:hypothetical protein
MKAVRPHHSAGALLSESIDCRLKYTTCQGSHAISHDSEEVSGISNGDVNRLRMGDRAGQSWREWGKMEIPGEALITPLLVVTFSCSYVTLLRDKTKNRLADAVTLQRYSTFATSMTGYA